MLPWSHCNNTWNTELCWTPSKLDSVAPENQSHLVDSVTEFWERQILEVSCDLLFYFPQFSVLQISPGIDHVDGLQPRLTLTLFIAWVICFFCIWRGVKSTGKAVYVTAIFPYFVMTALFIRGITLPGATDGLKFYLTPDFSRLGDGQVWIDAGTQIFFSYAIALGCMTALGSYNEFHNDYYQYVKFYGLHIFAKRLRQFKIKNANQCQFANTLISPSQLLFLCCMNTGTSFFAGFAIFSVLGFMAHEQNLTVGEIADGGIDVNCLRLSTRYINFYCNSLRTWLSVYCISKSCCSNAWRSVLGYSILHNDYSPWTWQSVCWCRRFYNSSGRCVSSVFEIRQPSGMVYIWYMFGIFLYWLDYGYTSMLNQFSFTMINTLLVLGWDVRISAIRLLWSQRNVPSLVLLF